MTTVANPNKEAAQPAFPWESQHPSSGCGRPLCSTVQRPCSAKLPVVRPEAVPLSPTMQPERTAEGQGTGTSIRLLVLSFGKRMKWLKITPKGSPEYEYVMAPGNEGFPKTPRKTGALIEDN